MDDLLSVRGRRLVDTGAHQPYWIEHHDRRRDPYDATANPDGYIGLCVAENKLMWDVLSERLTAAQPDLSPDAAGYDDMTGSLEFRRQLSAFLGQRVFGRGFAADQIAVLNGAGTVLEALFAQIADPGDGVLVPTPSYSGFWADLETRDELTILPVHTSSDTGFTLTEDLLDAAYTGADRPVRALLYTNPDNPTGRVATRDELEMVMSWTERRGIHLVSDELYALSVHGDAEFCSVAELADGLGDRIHLVWAFSKDFAVSGLRCGVLVSENRDLMEAIDQIAYWTAVPGTTQHLLGRLISDTEWVDGYIETMRARLRASYLAATRELGEHGIRHLPADAGFFFLIDLRDHLDEQTWEAEDRLWRRILNDGRVNLTPGSSCRIGEPGFLRLVFATVPTACVQEGARRIGEVLG